MPNEVLTREIPLMKGNRSQKPLTTGPLGSPWSHLPNPRHSLIPGPHRSSPYLNGFGARVTSLSLFRLLPPNPFLRCKAPTLSPRPTPVPSFTSSPVLQTSLPCQASLGTTAPKEGGKPSRSVCQRAVGKS